MQPDRSDSSGDSEDAASSAAGDDSILQYALNRFVTPVLWARSLSEEDLPSFELVSFFVFTDHADGALVQLNDEEDAWTPARATRSLQHGDALGPGDLHSKRVALPPRPSRGYISGLRTDEGWRVAINFSNRQPQARGAPARRG
jgi:hypothetical protein